MSQTSYDVKQPVVTSLGRLVVPLQRAAAVLYKPGCLPGGLGAHSSAGHCFLMFSVHYADCICLGRGLAMADKAAYPPTPSEVQQQHIPGQAAPVTPSQGGL